MTRRIILAALVGVLVIGPAWAIEVKDRLHVFGAGSTLCTKYLGAYGTADLKTAPDGYMSSGDVFAYELGWIQGYATRVNETTKGRENIYDMDTIGLAAWVASWCRDNPSKRILNAMEALTESRLKSKKVELGAGLDIRDVKSSREVEGGVDVLVVRGIIANVTWEDRKVPMIRIGLYDSDGREVQHVIAPHLKHRLEPGARIGFSAKLFEPSALARRLEVTFWELEKTGG